MTTSNSVRSGAVPRRYGIPVLVTLLVTIANVGRAQGAMPLPPVRQLGAPIAITRDTFASVTAVRGLSSGRVFIADGIGHRLLLYDSVLVHAQVVADSTPVTNKAFGSSKWVGLIPYRRDTTIFVDPASIALLVIDPQGRIVRTIAPPDPKQIGSLVPVPSYGGGGGFDADGRLVYRVTGIGIDPPYLTAPMQGVSVQSVRRMGGRTGEGSAPTIPTPPRHPTSASPSASRDSGIVLRGNMETRFIDTAGYLVTALTLRPGGLRDSTFIDPLPMYDEWAVTTDGSVAIVRALDYHIDWINADGTRTSTPRMAHEWGRRLSDSAKQAILDSTRTAVMVWHDRQDSISMAQAKSRGFAAVSQMAPIAMMNPGDMADYLPPFTQGAVKADADNRLWIREGWSPPPPAPGGPNMWWVPPAALQATSGPPIYDVVSRAGQIVDRVQLPPSLTLVGFGPGAVYLSSREGSGTVVAKYNIK